MKNYKILHKNQNFLIFLENQNLCPTGLAFSWSKKPLEPGKIASSKQILSFPSARSFCQDTLLLYAIPWGTNFWPEAFELSCKSGVALLAIYTCLIFIFYFMFLYFYMFIFKHSCMLYICCPKSHSEKK